MYLMSMINEEEQNESLDVTKNVNSEFIWELCDSGLKGARDSVDDDRDHGYNHWSVEKFFSIE